MTWDVFISHASEDAEAVALPLAKLLGDRGVKPRTGNGSGFRGREGGIFYDTLTASFGTPGFMSPEQELDGTVSETSDIYSLGMTLSMIFWPSLGRDDSRWSAKDGERGDREKALAQLIDAMTASNARDRPRRVQDVLDALAAV